MQSAPVGHAAGVRIPPELLAAPRWLIYTLEAQPPRPDGTPRKPRKVPRYATGEPRSGDLSADAGKLVSYEQACRAAVLHQGGLGFALGPDGAGGCWQGIDLDALNERPELAALQLPGYVERSPSGAGVHAIGYGQAFDALGANRSGVEAYSRERFFTFTGQALHSGPLVDLAPYVRDVLTPLHTAGRRQPGPISDRPALVTDDQTLRELADALRYLDPDDYATWTGVGIELRTLGEAGRALWEAWSATASRFPGGDDLERWQTFKPTRTGYAGVFVRATACGWKNPRALDLPNVFAGSGLAVSNAPLPTSNPAVSNAPAASALRLVVPPPPVPDKPAERIDARDFSEPGGQGREASLENVVAVLTPEAGIHIRYDEFSDTLQILDPSTREYRSFRDVDYALFRAALGARGFKPIKPEIMKSAVDIVAERNRVDTAKQWVESLQWDGVERIATSLTRYFGCADSEYTRAVGRYLFSALAARSICPGIKADMMVILVGMQGVGKTTAIEALVPFEQWFGEVNLTHRDENLSRKLRGKTVVEWAEMRGLTERNQESVKAWISNRIEEWVPKYKEFTTRYYRRCIVIGTANEPDLLDDPTGERRSLPLVAGVADVAALRADVPQLWAEGAALFAASGVAWQDAQRLAPAVHGDFKVHDDWQAPIVNWLEGAPSAGFGLPALPGKRADRPFLLNDLATQALGVLDRDLTMMQQKRIGKILKGLGFERKSGRIDGKIHKLWVRQVVTPPTGNNEGTGNGTGNGA